MLTPPAPAPADVAAPAAAPASTPRSRWLKVDAPPANAIAEENMRVAERQRESLNERARELSSIRKQIEAVVLKTTGSRWDRGKIKKSAKKADVAAYQKVQADLANVERQQAALYAMTRGDSKTVQFAKYAATVNDPNAPLVSRYAARLNLENEGGGDASQYDDLIAEWQSAVRDEVLSKYPDATPEEIKYLNAPIERAAYGARTRSELDRAWEMDSSLSLEAFRRSELDKTLDEVKFGQWANEIPDLRSEVQRFTTKDRNFENSRAPVERLTRENLSALQSKVRGARAVEEERKAAEKAMYEQAAAARAARQNLTAVVNERGITLSATPPTAKRISQMADRKQLRAQGEFVEKTLRELAKKAPDDNSIHEEYQADYAEIQTQQAAWRAGKGDVMAVRKNIETLADKIIPGWQRTLRTDQNGRYNPDKVAEKVIDAIRGRVPEGTPGQIVIEVPGDGTFRFANWRETLEAAADSVGKGLGKGIQYSGPTTPPTSARSLPKATKQTPADINKVLGDFTKDDKSHVLKDVLQDGPWTLASDGRTMILAKGGAGKGRDKIQGEMPAWRSFLASTNGLQLSDKTGDRIILGPGEKYEAPLDELLKKANSVIAALSDDGKKDYVQVHLGDKVGLSYSHPGIGDYLSDGVAPGQESNGTVDAYRLRDALEALRKLGSESVTIMAPRKSGEGVTPWVFRGGDTTLAVIQANPEHKLEPAAKIDETIAAAPAPMTSKDAAAPVPFDQPLPEKAPPAPAPRPTRADFQTGDEVTWTDGAGKKARATITKLFLNQAEGPVALVDWFGPKYVPLAQLTIAKAKGNREVKQVPIESALARATPPAVPAPDAATATARAKRSRR